MELFTLGRFRPVQGSIHAFCLYVGINGFISGPSRTGTLQQMYGDYYVFLAIFYCSLIVGSLIAMYGEIIQLRQPLVSKKVETVARTYTGIFIEMAGGILLSANMIAFAISVIFSEVQSARAATPYVFIGLGILGRTCQCIADLIRIRKGFADVLH